MNKDLKELGLQDSGSRTQSNETRRDSSEESYFDIYTDDGDDPQLLLGWGRKWDVFDILNQYDPQTVRVTELDRADEFATRIESLNGEEWLRQNSCPTCGRKQ